jgi:hypothetical protein
LGRALRPGGSRRVGEMKRREKRTMEDVVEELIEIKGESFLVRAGGDNAMGVLRLKMDYSYS